jgi:hypothetical protein
MKLEDHLSSCAEHEKILFYCLIEPGMAVEILGWSYTTYVVLITAQIFLSRLPKDFVAHVVVQVVSAVQKLAEGIEAE